MRTPARAVGRTQIPAAAVATAAADGGRRYPEHSAADGRLLFHGFMANWPTGVTVLTTQVGAELFGCTAQSLMSVSLEPPQLVVALAETSRTLAGLLRSGVFGLSILRAGQDELGRRFSVGAAQDRFRGTPVRTVHGVPLLTDAAATMVCRLGETWHRADHVLVIGLPLWQDLDQTADVLLRHRSAYRPLD